MALKGTQFPLAQQDIRQTSSSENFNVYQSPETSIAFHDRVSFYEKGPKMLTALSFEALKASSKLQSRLLSFTFQTRLIVNGAVERCYYGLVALSDPREYIGYKMVPAKH